MDGFYIILYYDLLIKAPQSTKFHWTVKFVNKSLLVLLEILPSSYLIHRRHK